MGRVVEQRPGETGGEQDQQASPAASPGDEHEASGNESEGAPLAPREESRLTGVDAEQWRQFEEFQRFQQFQRMQAWAQTRSEPDTAGTAVGTKLAPGSAETRPVAPTSVGTELSRAPTEADDPGGGQRSGGRRRVPTWLSWLGKKVLAWVLFFLLLALFVSWLLDQLFGSETEGKTSEELADAGGGTYRTEELLAKEPYEAVRKVYDAIAQEDPDTGEPLFAQACGYFDNDADIQQRFADNTGHPDCKRAVLALHEQVTHVNDYAESVFPRGYDPAASSVRIDSCEFDIEGGPALGVFTVTKVELGQWIITNHQPGPTTCSGANTPSGSTPSAPASN